EPTLALMATLAITTLLSVVSPGRAETPAQRPNIVVIWGDDIGQSNVSAYSHGLMGYSHGLMGYKTPNIDRIAKEGVMFTDYYGEQSCTAGQCPVWLAAAFDALP